MKKKKLTLNDILPYGPLNRRSDGSEVVVQYIKDFYNRYGECKPIAVIQCPLGCAVLMKTKRGIYKGIIQTTIEGGYFTTIYARRFLFKGDSNVDAKLHRLFKYGKILNPKEFEKLKEKVFLKEI